MATSEKCPKCGADIVGNSDRCESCQTIFWKYFSAKKDELGKKTRLLAEKRRRAGNICPKCGADISADPAECKSCGIYIEKFFTKVARDIKREKEQLALAEKEERERKVRREEEQRRILAEAIAEGRKQSGGKAEEEVVATVVVEVSDEPEPEPITVEAVEEPPKPQKWQEDEWKEGAKERWKQEARKRVQSTAAKKTAPSAPPSAAEFSPRQTGGKSRQRERSVSEGGSRYAEGAESLKLDGFTSKIVLALKFGGWAWLVAGILCLVYSLFNNANLLLGVVAFLQGVFGCILFLAVGSMAEKVALIAEKLEVNE